ncbi:MAG: NAD-dependent epimerase/dehydratase family protein, partial [Candidatus Micrarchaeia archaeon]
MPMRFLITGGAGFIGSHLADYLLAANHSVSVLDSFVSSGPGNLPSGAPVIKQDVCSQLEPSLFQDFDAVFHLAADPNVKDSALRAKESFVVNVSGTFNVLEACRKADVPKFVFTSSSVVYGEAKMQPTPEDAPTVPVSNYAASKLAGEAYCASFAHTYGMKCTVLRLANIIGERSTHGVMFDFYNKLRKNPYQLEILGDGKQNKSYLHVSDCVSGIVAASEKQSGIFDVYNVGSEEKRTVDEIARTLCSELNL